MFVEEIKYALRNTFTEQELETMAQVSNDMPCDICRKKDRFLSLPLSCCNHVICTTCVDELYDNYEPPRGRADILFVCKFCHDPVYSVEFS